MIRISANVYFQEPKIASAELCLNELFEVSKLIDGLLGTNKCWYEKGYSRKQALKHIVFCHDKANADVVTRWQSQIKKDYPMIIEGVWDGEVDSRVCSINYLRKHIVNPEKTALDISVTCTAVDVDSYKVLCFFSGLVKGRDNCHAVINTNGYWNRSENVFPDRVCAGWMIYVPSIILPDLIPQAAKVVPVMDGDKQKGTIVVSTEGIFDGSNKEHIARANDLEIRLLDLGLLPLMTEL